MALTVLQIKNTAAREREYKISDERGLYIRVRPNGSIATPQDLAFYRTEFAVPI